MAGEPALLRRAEAGLQQPLVAASPDRLLRRLIHDPTALLGVVILGTLLVLAITAPWVAAHDPAAQDVLNRYAGPSAEHLLGTDHLGRDVLSRLLFGARLSLGTAVLLGSAVLMIGVAVGTLAGFAGGLVDAAIMRVVDVLLAMPNFLLVLVIVGALGPGLVNLAIAFTVAGWVGYARIVRGLVLSVRERPYVESARAMGLRRRRVVGHHVLPSVLGPVAVLWTLRTGQLLLALAAFSFLGLGVQPPAAEWGAMLNEARDSLAQAPRLMIYPGVLITVAALAFNLIGDGIRDALDPTLRDG